MRELGGETGTRCAHTYTAFQRWKEIAAGNCEKSDDANFDSSLETEGIFLSFFLLEGDE